MSVRNASRWVDASQRRSSRSVRIALELPDDRRTTDAGGTVVRLAALEVIGNAVARLSVDPAGMLGQREVTNGSTARRRSRVSAQVMKSAAGVQRKTTAPTTSSSTWPRWIVRRAVMDTSRSFSRTWVRLDVRHRTRARLERQFHPSGAPLRARAGEGDDRASARDVVKEERNAAEGRPRRDVHDLPAAPARASPAARLWP